MPTRPAPAADFVVVMNAGSGRNDAQAARERIATLIEAAGKSCAFELVEDGATLPSVAREAALRVRKGGGALVACGGDGTINAVAAAALAEDVALGILPQGTFNFFGRTHGISSDIDEAVPAMLAARPRDAQAGLVNGEVFLVNASLGLYPQVLEDREAWKQRLGRRRIVALWSGLTTLLRDHRNLDIELEDGQRTTRLRTPTLVVGNNPLQFAKLGLDAASRIGIGELVAVTLRPIGKWKMLGLVLRGALGTLGDDDAVVTQAFRSITVRAPRGRRRQAKVAVDGEILRLEMPLVFGISPRPLRLLAPQRATADQDPG
jgi:diacylglycerol kinase family enzyme